jgi:hypothetical protein
MSVALYRGTSLIRKRPPPHNPPVTLGIGLQQGHGGVIFLVSEVPLYRGILLIKKSLSLGPYSRPVAGSLQWSWGVGVFVWARYPCTSCVQTKTRAHRYVVIVIKLNITYRGTSPIKKRSPL